jgi:hypothetical protein
MTHEYEKIVSIRIPLHILERIEMTCEGHTISEKVREFLCDEHYWKEFLVHKKNKLEFELGQVHQALTKNIHMDSYLFSPQESEFLKETVKILKDKGAENPTLIHGRFQGYINTFLRKITFRDFQMLLKRFEDGTKYCS